MRAGLDPTKVQMKGLTPEEAFPWLLGKTKDVRGRIGASPLGQTISNTAKKIPGVSKVPKTLGGLRGGVANAAGGRKAGLGVALAGLLLPEVLGTAKSLGGLATSNPFKGE